jgi:hypothetical protein
MSQAARRFPPHRRDRPVNPSTIWRWVVDGVRLPGGGKLRLEAARVGGRWLTSEQALARFIDAQTVVQFAPAERPATPRQRQHAAERAGETLEALGM